MKRILIILVNISKESKFSHNRRFTDKSQMLCMSIRQILNHVWFCLTLVTFSDIFQVKINKNMFQFIDMFEEAILFKQLQWLSHGDGLFIYLLTTNSTIPVEIR